MTEHDEISSVDDDASASAAHTERMDSEGSAVAPASPSQQDERTSRVQQLIRDKQRRMPGRNRPVLNDPVSAQRHFTPQRARDDA